MAETVKCNKSKDEMAPEKGDKKMSSLLKLPDPEPANSTDSLDYKSQNYDENEFSSSFFTGNISVPESHESYDIAIRETEQLCWLRGVVGVCLLISTFIVSLFIFYGTRKAELVQFEVQFEEHSSKIVESLQTALLEAIFAVDSLSIALMSQSQTQTIPYVELPDFAVRAASTRHMASAVLIAFVPIVQENEKTTWESFSVQSSHWIDEGLKYEVIMGDDLTSHQHRRRYRFLQESKNQTKPQHQHHAQQQALANFSKGIATSIYSISDDGSIFSEHDSAPYFPIWQHSPVHRELVNYDLLSHSMFGDEMKVSVNSRQVVIGQVVHTNSENSILTLFGKGKPLSNIYFPVFTDYREPRDLVGLLVAVVDWTVLLETNDLSTSASGIQIVLSNKCGQAYTFEIEGQHTVYMREGDGHDPTFDRFETVFDIKDAVVRGTGITYSGNPLNDQYCQYSMYLYPTTRTKYQYITSTPTIYTTLVVVVFMLTTLAFLIYDCVVQRRQSVVMRTAITSQKIVKGLFPSTVRHRLFGGGSDKKRDDTNQGRNPSETSSNRILSFANKYRTSSFSEDADLGEPTGGPTSNKPIADLFPNTTVLFADISGFTAWSSLREPAQVFTLLETLYSAFDKMAKRRKVFKVETIGDCYVAVTGLPDPQPDHAVIMSKFAAEILHQMDVLTRELETELGPDTAELAIRIGLHSGPVTAGVLRGQKSRFQLFGDTVNTAARMESNGKSNRIQCSQSTADLLFTAGKNQWIQAREELVHAKGKGDVQTYWITPKYGGHSGCDAMSVADRSAASNINSENDKTAANKAKSDGDTLIVEKLELTQQQQSYAGLSNQKQRFVDWNVDLLAKLLKKIIAARKSSKALNNRRESHIIANAVFRSSGFFDDSIENITEVIPTVKKPRDEYCEAITMPQFDPKAVTNHDDPDNVVLKAAVEIQLRDYVSTIARSYKDNYFHNFEHASHVVMAANKILKRVVAADDCEIESVRNLAYHLHDFTYGITSDPLTHFACIFSAMIHDVDHPGVSNVQLVKEEDEMAVHYDNKSVAEQNSIDVSWDLLMDARYADLRKSLFSNVDEMQRFRSLLVNSIMATDIFDQELKAMRESRWEKAFSKNENNDKGEDEASSNLKATIVIEHIIQASDVAHTMQHWHVYQKWNERLFGEMYTAYKSGRGTVDPSLGWYKGELWFYDNYIIPLARKLEDCGVFGVASDEFLTYALDNRREWEVKGEDIVKDMVQRFQDGSLSGE